MAITRLNELKEKGFENVVLISPTYFLSDFEINTSDDYYEDSMLLRRKIPKNLIIIDETKEYCEYSETIYDETEDNSTLECDCTYGNPCRYYTRQVNHSFCPKHKKIMDELDHNKKNKK